MHATDKSQSVGLNRIKIGASVIIDGKWQGEVREAGLGNGTSYRVKVDTDKPRHEYWTVHEGRMKVIEVEKNVIRSTAELRAKLAPIAPELFEFVMAYYLGADCGDGGQHDEDMSHGQCWHCTASRLVHGITGECSREGFVK